MLLNLPLPACSGFEIFQDNSFEQVGRILIAISRVTFSLTSLRILITALHQLRQREIATDFH
jgi:hypothetical protein